MKHDNNLSTFHTNVEENNGIVPQRAIDKF